jgi:anti-sigma regulatory factor (Ser/Thr protein kinase)
MVRTFDIPRDARAPMVAREAVRDIDGQFSRDQAELLVTELVTNAVRYGAGDTVRLLLDDTDAGGLRCEVIDDGHGFLPLARPIDEREFEGGWGLYLVERMSDSWGVREGSTHVWFELSPQAD